MQSEPLVAPSRRGGIAPGHRLRPIPAARPWEPEAGSEPYHVALLAPASGAAGLWGPSCIACATLATEAWNAAGGYLGREVRLTVIDASDESTRLEGDLSGLLADLDVRAIVGMCTSSVRERVTDTIGDRLPFVYTPLYEGGPLPAGVMAIGETPQRQLLPAITMLTERYRLRRWFLVGNDYCWPRQSHALALRTLVARGSTVVGSRYVPLGQLDVERIIDEIRESDAQAVLMSLVGQDAIDFSRAFGASGMAGRVLRLSCAIEENGLLGIGPDHTEGLFVSSGYFASLETDANSAFRERYWTRFGERAPTLNALGQSTYEGVAFLRGLLEHRSGADGCVTFDSVRATRWRSNDSKSTPIHLAEADGLHLRVVGSLDPGRDGLGPLRAA